MAYINVPEHLNGIRGLMAFSPETAKPINELAEDKAEAISDFADFIIKRYGEKCLSEDIQTIIANSKSFEFLNEEEELYTMEDLKQVYNAQS